MNDLGRRYFLFSGTPGGKSRIAAVLFIVACLLDIVAMVLDFPMGHRGHAIEVFHAATVGLLLVSAVLFLTYSRKAR